MVSPQFQQELIMPKTKLEDAKREAVELNEQELNLASGGSGIGDFLHRLGFAAGCILGGNELTVKGDQLQCKI
jgi:hypothetical protein